MDAIGPAGEAVSGWIAIPRYLGRYLLRLRCGHYRGWAGGSVPPYAPCLQGHGTQAVSVWKAWPSW